MAAACLHGEMNKMERQTVLAKFKAGAYRALVRTRHVLMNSGLGLLAQRSVFNFVLTLSITERGPQIAAAVYEYCGGVHFNSSLVS